MNSCFEVVVAFNGYVVTTTTSWMLGAGSVSDVIDFRLEQVITPRLFRFRSSRPPRVYDDYYFFVCVKGFMCVFCICANGVRCLWV